jgi:5-methylcytosine-specific restriction endonuclease McrA
MTYYEKLKDPRWQKKRLEVMERDEFTCQLCTKTDVTLNVHHKSYIYGNDPWDYELDNFVTYCEKCHSLEEQSKTTLKEMILELQKSGIPLLHILDDFYYKIYKNSINNG